MFTGPVPTILEAQEPDGYWVKPGPGYNPKYRSTVWSLSMLARLGADGSDARVRQAGEYVLDHSIDRNGAFSATGTPSGAILCPNGNLAAALLDQGWMGDERLHRAMEWVAKAVTAEGIAPTEEKDAPLRYLKSATCGPGFRCSANDRKPCAWGAVKVMLAFSKLPDIARTPLIQQAIEAGLESLLGRVPHADLLIVDLTTGACALRLPLIAAHHLRDHIHPEVCLVPGYDQRGGDADRAGTALGEDQAPCSHLPD